MIIGEVPSVDKGLFYPEDSEFLSGLLKKRLVGSLKVPCAAGTADADASANVGILCGRG